MTSARTSSLPSSSLPSPLASSPTSVDNLSSDDILEQLTNAKAQAIHYAALVKELTQALDYLVESGEICSDLNFNDWHIYRQPGKKTYTFPKSITDQEAYLKQTKELAIALGDATVKYGDPFWTVKYQF